ncbi:MAG: arylesterase [Cyclonatronaceae bacterium]
MILLFLFLLALQGQYSPADEPVNILFFGDSITAGYGIDKDQAFPAHIQDKLDSLNWNARAINAGLSGETSSGGLRRIDWLLRQRIDIMVLELGANDGLRGIDLDLTHSNLQAIIDRTRTVYPEADIVIAGMQVPPNLGRDYTDQFRTMFISLAENNDATLIPFILEGVAGIPELNLPDGIHPTDEGHQIIADTVWITLKPIIRSKL